MIKLLKPKGPPRWVWLACMGVATTVMADDQVEQGKTIATSGGAGGVLACVTCHGAQGEGNPAAGFPFLAGQGAEYIAEQIHNFASGERDNPVMHPIAKAMNDEQITAVAAYYAQLPPPFNKEQLAQFNNYYPDAKDAGAWVVHRGDWANNIPACIQCHGPGAVGVGVQFPALAGQSAKYIAEQLHLWQNDKRAPGPQAVMSHIAKRMTDEQIAASAAYLEALPSHATQTEAKP